MANHRKGWHQRTHKRMSKGGKNFIAGRKITQSYKRYEMKPSPQLSPYARELIEGLNPTEVMANSTPEQKKVLQNFQAGTERMFLMYLRQVGGGVITPENIDSALQIMVNSVEGDVTQLEAEHEKYARRKGWLEGYE